MRHSLCFFFLLMFLSACGFEPMYKDEGSVWGGNMSGVSSNLNTIDIAVIPNYEGQVVRNHLIDRFYKGGYPVNPLYRLETAPVQESILEIGVDKDDNASRAQLRQSTTFRLVRLSDNEVVLQRTVRATTGYNILEGQFTTYVTESDARKQALRTLADSITTQVELYFSRAE